MSDRRLSRPEPQSPPAGSQEPHSEDPPPPPVGVRILHTTAKVGQEVVKARRDLAATHSTVEEIHRLLAPSEEESPVLAALEQVLLALRHQAMAIETLGQDVAAIKAHLRIR